jgi:hypothetical protein
MKCTFIQERKDFKTLIWKLVGVITFVIGPDSLDLKLRGTCASAVLQCGDTITISMSPKELLTFLLSVEVFCDNSKT